MMFYKKNQCSDQCLQISVSFTYAKERLNNYHSESKSVIKQHQHVMIYARCGCNMQEGNQRYKGLRVGWCSLSDKYTTVALFGYLAWLGLELVSNYISSLKNSSSRGVWMEGLE
jgi:hypothetical protein